MSKKEENECTKRIMKRRMRTRLRRQGKNGERTAEKKREGE